MVETIRACPPAPGIVEGPSSLGGYLNLDRVQPDLFRGSCHDGAPMRAMGGLVAAQALTAAGLTVDVGQRAHSLHGWFLRAGSTSTPVVYQVERLRDGRSYTTRQVAALQNGRQICTLFASFKHPEDSPERQQRMPDVPTPELLPDAYRLWGRDNPEAYRSAIYAQVTDMRIVPFAESGAGAVSDGFENRQHVWFRTRERLPESPLRHAAALTYYADLSLPQTAALDREQELYPFRGQSSHIRIASLDHSVWFHRPFRADEWLLFAQRSPSACDGRGFSMGDFWTQDGVLVASVVQEAVLRRFTSTI